MIGTLGRSLYRAAVPTAWQKKVTALRKLYSILESEYGYLRTVSTGDCVDAAGNPLPWYTYPAIEYLQQLDFSQKRVFEYGCGNSTLFWGCEAKRLDGVEHDPAWYAKIAKRLPSNCSVALEQDPTRYFSAITRHELLFDVIVIDGFIKGQSRLKCAKAATGKLAEGGVVILDNSNWLPKTASYLRNLGLLEVDFNGLGPIGPWTWTTSLFFHRRFSISRKNGQQPRPAKGALVYQPEVDEQEPIPGPSDAHQ